MTTLIIFSEKHKLLVSLCSGTDIIRNNLFPVTHSLRSYLSVRDQVSHPYIGMVKNNCAKSPLWDETADFGEQ